MKTVILASALIISTASLSIAAIDKEIKKVNTTTSAIITLPVTIEAHESLTIKTSNNELEKAQYTPEQKAAIVGLEFKSAKK
jgi:hypothetical protein